MQHHPTLLETTCWKMLVSVGSTSIQTKPTPCDMLHRYKDPRISKWSKIYYSCSFNRVNWPKKRNRNDKDNNEFTCTLWFLETQCPCFWGMWMDWVRLNVLKCVCSKKNVDRNTIHPTSSDTIQHCPPWCSNGDNMFCPTMLDDVAKCCIRLSRP